MPRILLCLALLVPGVTRAQADSTPRDSLLVHWLAPGSGAALDARALRRFVLDDPRHALTLVPGVVLRGAETGLASAGALSIRGGAPGGAAVYIDGAPVRFLIGGGPGVSLGVASIAGVTVATGVPDLRLPDFRDGVIAYTARSGTARLAGDFSVRTDEAFDGAGFSRFEGGVGGPMPIANATWFVGGTLTGQRSHFVGLGGRDVPSFVPAGIDTTITRTVSGQTQSVSLPSFMDHRAYDWGTELRAHAKVAWAATSGARFTVTGIANQTQERFFPGPFALAPALYTGAWTAARLVVANWHQQLGSLRGRPATLQLHASIGTNEQMAGLLTPASEAATTAPSLGITLATLDFAGADAMPFPLTDQIVRNMRVNSGLRVPYLNRDELRNIQTSRANPFGMERFWAQSGLDGPLTMTRERRTEARLALEWEAVAGHRVTVGGDVANSALSHYTANLLRQSSMDVYRADPSRWGLYIANRIARGSWDADLALRLAHFGSTGLFPRSPGRIYSNPAFNRPAAISTDTGYTNSLARVMERGRERSAVGFHASAARPLGSATTLRVALGSWIEPPTLGWVLRGSNNDLDFTNTNDPSGRDVDYGRAFHMEIGAALKLRAGLAADVALYHRSGPLYAYRIQPFPDPANPGDTYNANALADPIRRVDYGVEGALDWRSGSWAVGRLVYGVRFSDTPEAGSVGSLSQSFFTHALAAAIIARPSGGVLHGTEAALLLRAASGLPYTRLDPAGGSGALAVRPVGGLFSNAIEPLNSSRTPWTRALDLRVSRVIPFGRQQLAVFADVRNVLNLRNTLNLFAETGDVENPNFREQMLDVEFQSLEREALDNSRLLSNGDIDLRPNCQSWTVTSGLNGAVVNCIALRRAETRFGNGDGLYSLTERETALYAFYNAFFGPHTFYGAGRSVRLGVEIRW